jgi:hypothetical protein
MLNSVWAVDTGSKLYQKQGLVAGSVRFGMEFSNHSEKNKNSWKFTF